MTEQVNRQNVQRENLPARGMANRLRDFTRMNSLIITGPMTLVDPREFLDEVHNILVSMGATGTEKVDFLPIN